MTNLDKMVFETQWAGQQLIRTGFLSIEPYVDVPAPFLQTLIIPADPPSLMNARPEPYTIDETDWRTTQADDIRITQSDDLRVTQPSQYEADSEDTG